MRRSALSNLVSATYLGCLTVAVGFDAKHKGFQRLGVPFWGSYSKDCNISASILASLPHSGWSLYTNCPDSVGLDWSRGAQYQVPFPKCQPHTL